MQRSRLILTLVLVLLLSTSVSMTSCGGGSGGTNPDLVLLGFNLPNISGIALNEPLIFTFSASINPATITPDTLRVVGSRSPFFEATVVDGNLVGMIPTVPNFADYSDAGYAPDTEYTVSLSEFPAVTTIESTTGKPLLSAASFTFRTLPAPSTDIVAGIRCSGPDGILGTADDTTPTAGSFFVEPRRAIRHGTPPSLGGRSDDEGCLQNSANSLYVDPITDPSVIQSGSGPGARLLCFQNEGSPRVIESLCSPRHNQQAVGSPSSVAPGFIDLPAIRIKVNEPVDPLTVEPFFAGIPINVQLWRVALKDGTPVGPDQILTNKPLVVQRTEDTEIILVPAGAVPQGTFLVNITPAIKDLPGCPLRIDDRPDPAIGGYDVYEGQTAFTDAIQPGYRIYFKTLEVPNTPLSIIEDFNNNLAEWGDNQSAASEPGLFAESVLTTNPLSQPLGPFPALTRLFDPADDMLGVAGGQSTTALWNSSGAATPGDPITAVNGYRFLNIPTLPVAGLNPFNDPVGKLLHVRQPYFGTGQDGAFDSGGGGGSVGLNTDTGSVNGDGIYEYVSFRLQAGDTLTVSGSKPLLIFCQGEFLVEGDIDLSGQDGGHGFDADGTTTYTNPGSVSTAGLGGAAGPGGGAGGGGAETLAVNPTAPTQSGNPGHLGATMFEAIGVQFPTVAAALGGGGFQETGLGDNDGSQGGGGGGFSVTGTPGSTKAPALSMTAFGGDLYGSSNFERDITLFQPDRAYQPNANCSGGSGGGGGGIEDDLDASEDGDTVSGPGDDGGAGGGGAGGGMWVIANLIDVRVTGTLSVNGGVGGNTYGPADQLLDGGPDGMQGGGDDLFLGLAPGAPATGTGDGGPGGGGSGGSIVLIGKAGVSIAGTVSAAGGAGGTSNDAARSGGTGAPGRVAFKVLQAGVAVPPGPVVSGGVTAGSTDLSPWITTIEDMSVGQSEWTDLFTPTAKFAPVVNGIAQFPTHAGNFQFPGAVIPGFLETPRNMGGGGQTYGFGGAATFNARLEFQGADSLTPEPGVGTPTSAAGLTQWFDVSMITSINDKRFFRWRWRFWSVSDYGEQTGAGMRDPNNLPVPTVNDLTIPFTK